MPDRGVRTDRLLELIKRRKVSLLLHPSRIAIRTHVCPKRLGPMTLERISPALPDWWHTFAGFNCDHFDKVVIEIKPTEISSAGGVRPLRTGNYTCIDALFFRTRTLWATKGPKAQLSRPDTLHETSALRTQVAFNCFRCDRQKFGHRTATYQGLPTQSS